MPGRQATFRTCSRAFSSSPDSTIRRLANTRPGTRMGGRCSSSHSKGATSRTSGSDGQSSRKSRAGPRFGVELERAAVRLGDRAGDEEAEARAGLRSPTGVDAAELLEYQPLLLGRNAGTVVADRERHEAVG